MSLSVDFKPGMEQSFEAGHYFTELASELVESFIADMRPRQYLVGDTGKDGIAVRIWSTTELVEEEVTALLPWIRSLQRDLHVVEQGTEGVEAVQRIMENWTTMRAGEKAFFLEKLHATRAFTEDEHLELSVGVLGGSIVMVSAPKVMYVQQAPGLFGLSVASQGSYLIEREARDKLPIERLRRA